MKHRHEWSFSNTDTFTHGAISGDIFAWRAVVGRRRAIARPLYPTERPSAERHEGELDPRARTGDYAVLATAVALVGLSIAAPIFLLAWLVGLLL